MAMARIFLALTLAATAAAFSSLPMDDCGVPDGTNACMDQCGVPFGTNACLDQCGVPFGSDDTCLDNFGVVNGACFCKTADDCTSNGVDVSSEGRCYCGVHVTGYDAFCYVDASSCPDSETTSRYGSPEQNYKFNCLGSATQPPPSPPSTPVALTVLGEGKCGALTGTSNGYSSGYSTAEGCAAACGDSCVCFSHNEATGACEVKTGTCYYNCGATSANDGWTAYSLG